MPEVKQENVVGFTIGSRSVIGELVEETADALRVNKPVCISLQPTQDGRLQVQLFPYWFNELTDPEATDDADEWTFPKAAIVQTTKRMKISGQLIDQYNKIANPSPIITPTAAETSKVVKLFD